MDLLKQFIELVLHLDRHLDQLVSQFGPWIYVILFLVIFAETGLVVTPILPGDSLLFAVGAIAARPEAGLSVTLIMVLLFVAAVLGDGLNYLIGKYSGEKLLRMKTRWINPKHIEKTQEFYQRYGGKTIVIARFIPIVRTFAPFVAGIGRMGYGRFMWFNIAGGLLWIVSVTLAGYFFGNIEIIRKNFGLVVIGIIVVSILPAVIEVLRARKKA